MRALTVWQPWAWAIVHGGKRLENRTWRPPTAAVGGLLAIHAAGRPVDADELDWFAGHYDLPGAPPARADIVRSAVVGVVRLVGWFDRQRFSDSLSVTEARALWSSQWREGPVCWVLSEQVALPEPVRCSGHQGLWNLPPDVERWVRWQVAGVLEDA